MAPARWSCLTRPLAAAVWVAAAVTAPPVVGGQTESALPATAAPLFRVEGWVERVDGAHVTLRAPDGRPLTIDMSEVIGSASALTPGRRVGVTVVALADGSLTAKAVAFDYDGP